MRALAVAAALLACSGGWAQSRVPDKTAPSQLPPLPPAVIDDTLAIGGEEIGGRKARTRMTVDVRVNGQGPYRFVVDSGADTSIIGTKVARALALPPGRPVNLHSITASARVGQVLVDELSFGQSTIRALELPVLDDGDLGGAGMIGIDALVEQRLLLDFEKRVIKVEDAQRPPQRLDGEIVVIARRRKGQLILTEARANGRPVDAVIDTGSEITIGNAALRKRLVGRGDRLTTIAVTGVTGVTVNLELARVAELRLGPVILRDVPIAFADVPPFRLFGLNEAPALLLGTDLMETFRRVSLDFRARKVRFQLRRCGAEGVSFATSIFGSASRLSSEKGNTAVCR